MGESGATSAGADLFLELKGHRLRAGFVNALREAVRTGRLAPGTRLPSSRSLAADLGIARNTVADSYAELVAEGWLTAQQGSGTRVAKRAEPRARPAAPRTRLTTPGPTYNLLLGSPNLAEFPRKLWLAAARRALTAAPNDAFALGDALGRVELRTALADYLARARGVYAEPGRVVICSGFHHGLQLVAQALQARQVRSMAVEAYGLDIYRDLLAGLGMRTLSLYVDERGARTEDLARLRGDRRGAADPGAPVPDGRRAAPGPARGGHRLGPLHRRADPGGRLRRRVPLRPRAGRRPAGPRPGPGGLLRHGQQVAGAGAAARPGWWCPPTWCRTSWRPRGTATGCPARWTSSRSPSSSRPAPTTGTYARPGCTTGAAATSSSPPSRGGRPAVRVTGMAAGLQVVVELPNGTERAVVEEAAREGLAVSGMAEFRYEVADSRWQLPARDALVVNYAAPSGTAWTGALDALCRVLSTLTPR